MAKKSIFLGQTASFTSLREACPPSRQGKEKFSD